MTLHRDQLTVSAMCRALEGARSGSSAWRKRPPSPHAQAEQVLSERIGHHCAVHRHVYGTRRLKACFAQEGTHVSRRRLGRLMAAQALQVNTRRTCTPTTDASHGQAVAPNVRQRPCDIDQPETASVGAITSIWTAEGWWYLAVVIDVFSRAVVGWSMNRWRTAARVTNA
jgi:putative transposase